MACDLREPAGPPRSMGPPAPLAPPGERGQEDAAAGGPEPAASARPPAGGPQRVLSIVVPEGAGAGTELDAGLPDGRRLTISVPEGVSAGAVLTLSEDAATGAWSCRAEAPAAPEAPEAAADAAAPGPRAARAEEHGAPPTVSVTVPPGTAAGATLECTAPDGTALALTVPEGVPEGSVLSLTQDPATGSWICEAHAAADGMGADPRAVGAGGGGSPAAAAEGARVEAPEECAAGSAGAAAAEGRGAAGPAGAARELTITVPEGALPGTELCGRAPDGSEMCVEVPEGALPGSVLAVSRDPATGAWRSESRQRPDAGGSPSEAAGRSPAADAGGPVTVRLAVPAGATAGCKVDFTTPEGVELCMVVPDGVRQGAELVLTRASADAPWQCEVGSPGPAPPETPPAQPASPQPASPQRPQAPGTLLQRLAAAAAAAPGGGPSPEGAAATSPVGLGPAFSFAAAAAGEPAPAPGAPLQLAAASGVSVGSPPAAALEVEVSLLGPRRAPRGAEVEAAPPHRQPGSPAGQQQNWAQAAQERSPIPRHASEDFDDCCDDMDEGVHAGPSIADQLGAFSRTTAVGAKARSSSRPPSPPRPGGHGPACGEARCRPASPSRPACPPPPPSPPPLDFPDLGAPRDALGQEAPYVPPSSQHELHLDGQVPSSGSYVPPPWAQSQPLEQRRSYVPPPAASAHFAPLPQIPHGAQVPAPPELGRSLSPPLQRPGAGASHSPPAFASGIGTYPAAGPFQHGPSISTLPGQDGAHAGGQEQQGPWPPPQALPNPLMAGLQELKVPGLRPLAVPQIFPAPCAAAPLGSLPLVPPGVGGMPGPGPVPFGAPRPHLLGSAYGPPPPLQGQPPTHLYAPVHPAHGAMHGFPVPGYR